MGIHKVKARQLNDLAKNIILWIIIAIVLLTVFQSFGTGGRQSEPLDYSTFLELVDTGQVKQVVFDGDSVKGDARDRRALRDLQPRD